MTLAEIQTQYEYNDWANDRLVLMLSDVFGEETELPDHVEPQVVAIHAAALHILWAQAVWRNRWQENPALPHLPAEEYSTPLSLRMAFGAERARFWGFFATLGTDADLAREIAYKNLRGEPFVLPLSQMMPHVVMHGAYHRGQITGRLLDMGYEAKIVSTDLIGFSIERNAR